MFWVDCVAQGDYYLYFVQRKSGKVTLDELCICHTIFLGGIPIKKILVDFFFNFKSNTLCFFIKFHKRKFSLAYWENASVYVKHKLKIAFFFQENNGPGRRTKCNNKFWKKKKKIRKGIVTYTQHWDRQQQTVFPRFRWKRDTRRNLNRPCGVD